MILTDAEVPDGWQTVTDQTSDPLLEAWRAQDSQWLEVKVTGVIMRNTRADDVLLSLADGRVAEVHIGYHGAHLPTFDALSFFDSVASWLESWDERERHGAPQP